MKSILDAENPIFIEKKGANHQIKINYFQKITVNSWLILKNEASSVY